MKRQSQWVQRTIFDVLADAEELFPDDGSQPALRRSSGPVVGSRASVVFPGAVDAVGAVPAPVSGEVKAVPARRRVR